MDKFVVAWAYLLDNKIYQEVVKADSKLNALMLVMEDSLTWWEDSDYIDECPYETLEEAKEYYFDGERLVTVMNLDEVDEEDIKRLGEEEGK